MTRAQAQWLRRIAPNTARFANERAMLDYFFWHDDFQLYGPSFPKLNHPEFVK